MAYRHLVKHLSAKDAYSPLPPGIILTAFDPSVNARQVHGLIAGTYADAGDPFPAFEQWLADLLADPDYSVETIFLVQSAQDVLLGAALCWRGGFVKDLAVSPDYRRRGIGEYLLRHAFAHFTATGHDTVELKVTLGNVTGAERLYRRLGMMDNVKGDGWAER